MTMARQLRGAPGGAAGPGAPGGGQSAARHARPQSREWLAGQVATRLSDGTNVFSTLAYCLSYRTTWGAGDFPSPVTPDWTTAGRNMNERQRCVAD